MGTLQWDINFYHRYPHSNLYRYINLKHLHPVELWEFEPQHHLMVETKAFRKMCSSQSIQIQGDY